ncbi:MAG: response regulator [Methyloceanibacter sp.]
MPARLAKPIINHYVSHKTVPVLAQEGVDLINSNPILVVEDEFLIALDIVAALESAGLDVVGPASTVSDALSAIQSRPLRGALLDAHLGGESAGRIADVLATRGLPFAFVSGYGRESLPTAHSAAPLVRKPFTDQEILAAVAGF